MCILLYTQGNKYHMQLQQKLPNPSCNNYSENQTLKIHSKKKTFRL